jgi:predicted AlkP superfamily phosphohydrolase/phosphomutase
MEKKPWTFLVYVCRATDQVQHFFWKYTDPEQPLYVDGAKKALQDAITSIYCEIDSHIGELLRQLDEDDTIIIMSDHGQGGNLGKAIHLNAWLNKLGLLEFESPKNRSKGQLMGFMSGGLSGDMVDRAKRIIPRRLKSLVLEKLPFVRDKIESHVSFVNIDWRKTKAYSEENRGNIWINLKGRQREGTVAKGVEYEALRERLAKELLAMTDPDTGGKIVKQVFKREDLYSGPFLEKAPDLLFTQHADPYAYLLRKTKPGMNKDQWLRNFTAQEKRVLQSGSHRMDGILVASGHWIKRGGALGKDASIMDVAPTVLYLMGLPVPEEMDGKVLKSIFTEDFLSENQVRYTSEEPTHGDEGPVAVYSADEEGIIAERLRGLGYFE